MYKQHIYELAGGPSVGKSTLLNDIKSFSGINKDIKYVEDSARTYIANAKKPIDEFDFMELREMQRELFAEILEEMIHAEREKKALVIDSGLLTNIAYSKNVTGEQFYQNQINLLRSFSRYFVYNVLYCPPYFNYDHDGLRHNNLEIQGMIDGRVRDLIQNHGIQAKTIPYGSREYRAKQAIAHIK